MMAHRTRRRFTKTELRKDPVAENLSAAWLFVRGHLREVVIACVVVVVGIVVIQSISASSRRQKAEAMANYLLAETIFEQAEQLALAERPQEASAALMQAYTLASTVYDRNRTTEWGVRAGLLAAKAGILLGRNDEVIESMQAMISSGPDRLSEASARLHLATALENRASIEDLATARVNYDAVASDSADFPVMAAEALSGLSRIDYVEGAYEQSLTHLQRSLEMRGDTTGFDDFQLARLQMALGGTSL
jgi:tetratricopeptide (TPR) repeat protein